MQVISVMYVHIERGPNVQTWYLDCTSNMVIYTHTLRVAIVQYYSVRLQATYINIPECVCNTLASFVEQINGIT